MSTKVFLILLFFIFITFLIYEDTLYYRYQSCGCEHNEPYQEQREELENNDMLDYTKTSKEIENIVNIVQSPFYKPPTLDINTALTNTQKIYGSKEKKAQIGHLRKNEIQTLKEVHQPLLNYYDTVNWFERDMDHDFDMFLK